jgi:hypothetical protein
LDLSTLFALVNVNKDFNITGGYITGEMEFRGPVANPEFYGYGRATSMRFQVPEYISEDIRTVPFNVLAEGYEMQFGPVVSLCGTGGGNVTGWFLFQNWIPAVIGLDINILRENPVPYDINLTGFLANGTASGNLNITIDNIQSLTEIKGSLFTNDAELGLNTDEFAQGELEFQDDIDTFLDLTITTGSKVEFIWPTTNPIIRANPELGTVIRVSSDTQSGQFSLDSDIKIRSGEIYYFDRNFFIRQGNIVFRENETQFDPRISTRAETRDRAEDGPVTISLIVENQSLLSFNPRHTEDLFIRFESTPSLTQLELYSILGQNFNSIQGEESVEMAQRFLLASATDLAAQVVASSDVLSQFVFFRQFERQIRDTLRMDMFSVRTRFLHNAVITGASGLGVGEQVPDDRGYRVGNYFDNTTVFIGKYIGQHMFIHGMLTMRYDENSAAFGGLTVEPDIGIELQSPFVNIRWEFFPMHPENWWVTDQSITLSWSMSF